CPWDLIQFQGGCYKIWELMTPCKNCLQCPKGYHMAMPERPDLFWKFMQKNVYPLKTLYQDYYSGTLVIGARGNGKEIAWLNGTVIERNWGWWQIPPTSDSQVTDKNCVILGSKHGGNNTQILELTHCTSNHVLLCQLRQKCSTRDFEVNGVCYRFVELEYPCTNCEKCPKGYNLAVPRRPDRLWHHVANNEYPFITKSGFKYNGFLTIGGKGDYKEIRWT
ncbi:unnamed protein product, partial [Meganyctiphanes norvegica]